ncbi:MAG: hypothetical protein Phog2KO_38290 [Phototrophicaceae bacterium]
MKRLSGLFLVALLLMITGVVAAQDDTTEDIITITIPDVLVICPGQSVLPTVREAARLVIEFADAEDVLVVPFGTVAESDGVTTITIGRIRLTCDSTASEFNQIDRSPAVPINETIPQPDNVIGIAETQSGYLVVTTLNANLRSCDLPTCSRVGIVHNSDYLVALGTNGETDDRLWWYVQVGDITGWIWGDLVVGRGDLTDLPIIETEGEPTPATVYLGFTGNPIYNVLGESAQSLCAVQASDNYPLLGRNFDTTWVFIEAQCTDGTTVQGWMNADNVAIRNTGNVFVPILNSDGTPR